MEAVQSDKMNFSGRIQNLRKKLHRMEGFTPVEKITPALEQTVSQSSVGGNQNADTLEL